MAQEINLKEVNISVVEKDGGKVAQIKPKEQNETIYNAKIVKFMTSEDQELPKTGFSGIDSSIGVCFLSFAVIVLIVTIKLDKIFLGNNQE